MTQPRTLLDKLWDAHEILRRDDGASLLWVDRHLVHEGSHHAFAKIGQKQIRVKEPNLTFGVLDHYVPTNRVGIQTDPSIPRMMQTLRDNAAMHGFKLFDMTHQNRGIVHVIGPELGLTLPGLLVNCGDSHTSTHGAFGALALGIGTSDVEHVLASQTMWLEKPKPFEIKVEGKIKNPHAVTAKDIVLSIIKNIGTGGGMGTVIEYSGQGISDLSMEQRMTICNMSIEAGARAGMIAPDEKTFDYLRDRKYTPKNYDDLVEQWKTLKTDSDAKFEKEFVLDINDIAPQVSWGTNPGMTCDVTDTVPTPDDYSDGDENQKKGAQKALDYMDLKSGTAIEDIKVNRVFIGSCTNARLEDLIEASKVVKGQKVSSDVNAMVVPGSQMVKKQAEEMGLDKIFTDANFEWREAGCSMCLGMNPDILSPGDRCASTSNRNFEGRQGAGGRTHLVSPVMAAAAAINGHFVDVRKMDLN